MTLVVIALIEDILMAILMTYHILSHLHRGTAGEHKTAK